MADGKSQIAQRGECEQGELLTTDFLISWIIEGGKFFRRIWSNLVELTMPQDAESWRDRIIRVVAGLHRCIVPWNLQPPTTKHNGNKWEKWEPWQGVCHCGCEGSLNQSFERCLAEIQAPSFIQGMRFQGSGILFFGLTRLYQA